MKKLFIAASLVIGMIAGAMVLSSFSEPKEKLDDLCLQISNDQPVYWQGTARRQSPDLKIDHGSKGVRIKVYQVEGMCNSYKAVVVDGTDKGQEIWVRDNPQYDPNKEKCKMYNRSFVHEFRYQITLSGGTYYFNM